MSRMERIVQQLDSINEASRESAADDLEKFAKQGMSVEEGTLALRSAARTFPLRRYEFQNSSVDLIRAAAQNPRSEYIPIVAELFPKYGDKARQEALVLLSEIESREAAVAFMRILREHEKEGRIPELPTYRLRSLRSKPRHPEVFFPELFKYTGNPKLAPSIYELCLAYCEARLLSPSLLVPYTGQLLQAFGKYRDRLSSAQRPAGVEWMWEEDYQIAREEAGVLLDLIGYSPASEKVEATLREALRYADPKLRLFAALSLLRLGKEVSPSDIAEIAASAEVRNTLYTELGQLGMRDLFPRELRTGEAFAESAMVRWLAFPTELNRVPDDIELMKIVSFNAGPEDGILDYYVFRFRTHPPHWGAKNGWMAGVAGPSLRKEEPSPDGFWDTFSSFEAWEGKAPEEHVGGVLETLEKWHSHQEQKIGK